MLNKMFNIVFLLNKMINTVLNKMFNILLNKNGYDTLTYMHNIGIEKKNKLKNINVRLDTEMYDSITMYAEGVGLTPTELARIAMWFAFKVDQKKIKFIRTKGEYGKLNDEDLIPALVDRAAKHLGYE